MSLPNLLGCFLMSGLIARELSDYMSRLKSGAMLAEMGYGEVKIQVAIGDSSTEIIDCAKEIAADLIVLPSHGRKGLSRFYWVR